MQVLPYLGDSCSQWRACPPGLTRVVRECPCLWLCLWAVSCPCCPASTLSFHPPAAPAGRCCCHGEGALPPTAGTLLPDQACLSLAMTTGSRERQDRLFRQQHCRGPGSGELLLIPGGDMLLPSGWTGLLPPAQRFLGIWGLNSLRNIPPAPRLGCRVPLLIRVFTAPERPRRAVTATPSLLQHSVGTQI